MNLAARDSGRCWKVASWKKINQLEYSVITEYHFPLFFPHLQESHNNHQYYIKKWWSLFHLCFFHAIWPGRRWCFFFYLLHLCWWLVFLLTTVTIVSDKEAFLRIFYATWWLWPVQWDSSLVLINCKTDGFVPPLPIADDSWLTHWDSFSIAFCA